MAGLDGGTVLRRRPVRIMEGSARRRLDRGIRDHLLRLRDDPDLDYRDVSPELQQAVGAEYPVTSRTARIVFAWASRNTRQQSPERRGAGSMPPSVRISHTVDGASA